MHEKEANDTHIAYFCVRVKTGTRNGFSKKKGNIIILCL